MVAAFGRAALPRHSARRVLRALRRGSSSPVVIDTSAGQFVAKLRGAAQGLPPLVAEIIVAELAEALGLPVPERVIVTFEADLPSDDGNDELRDLLTASVGDNLGLRWLPGATDLRLDQLDAVDPDTAATIAWLDGLVMNPDRTPQNPNILLWHRQPWLIDHGAALPFHHDWDSVTEQSPREVESALARHLFASRAGPLASVDGRAARVLSLAALNGACARVPDAFLSAAFPGQAPERVRAAYVAFLWKRLKPPRPFVPDATA